MVSRLPLDLFRAIIEDYLQSNLRLLVQLDIAFCNHKLRSDLLALLDHISTVNDKKYTKSTALEEYLKWMTTRKVQVSRLLIDNDIFLRNKLTFLSPCECVHTIELVNHNYANDDTSVELIVHCLNQFPSLEVVCCRPFVTDEQLLGLQALQRPLHGLDLSKLSRMCKLPSQTVAEFVSSLGNGIRTLKLNLMNEAGLALIADHCHGLTTLQLDCSDFASPDDIVRLCASNALTLSDLALHSSFWSLDDIIPRIAPCLPNLVNFLGHSRKETDSSVCTLLFLANCPRICSVKLRGMTVLVVQSTVGMKKVLDVSISKELVVQDLVPFFSQLTTPIQTCRVVFTEETAAASSLVYLGQRFGSTIESLDLDLLFDSIPERSSYLQALLRSCANLVHLKIRGPSNNDIILQHLAELASSCQHLRKLSVGTSTSKYMLNADDMLPMLCAFKVFPDNVVDELEFPTSTTLTNTMLHAIAEAFPRLHVLSCMYAAVDKEALLDLILTGKLKAKRIYIPVQDCARWISDELQLRGVSHKLVERHFLLCLPM